MECHLENIENDGNISPRYNHDCGSSIFLGYKEKFDLYVSVKNNIMDNIIARYGNNKQEYISGIEGSQYIPALAEALKRALDRKIEVKKQHHKYKLLV